MLCINDDAGMYSTETIWDDANPDQMETLKPTQVHRPVDLKIVAADSEGELSSLHRYSVLTFTSMFRLHQRLYNHSFDHLEHRKGPFV